MDRTSGIRHLWATAGRPGPLSSCAGGRGAKAGGAEVRAQLYLGAKRLAGSEPSASGRCGGHVRCTFEAAKMEYDRGVRFKTRSEERRVGEEGRSRWAPDHL